MPEITCLQIDAFADEPFTGNPAAVCLLDEARDEQWMQAVAAEMNLSETAFVLPSDGDFQLRWFTPVTEVDLCGHATLAAAHALWSEHIVDPEAVIRFQTRSGELTCSRRGDRIELDFPATPVEPDSGAAALGAALGVEPIETKRSRFDGVALLASADALRALDPDFAALARLPYRGVIATSPSDDPRYDFLSRFFGPAVGVDEDPVTGSAHCALAPYWAARLGKLEMTAFQASRRGGVVSMRLDGDRVLLAGRAVTVLRGVLV